MRISIALLVALGAACSGGGEPKWEMLAQDEPGALLSVWGASADDVWVVGGDSRDGNGPLVFHIEEGELERVDTGETSGDLWWVFGFPEGPVFMGGSGGMILRYQDGGFTRMSTPGMGTVFGLWGSSPTDMWAVGGSAEEGGAFAWRLEGDEWIGEPSLPADAADAAALWKVHGTGPDDAWLVGSEGLSFHWNGETLERGDTGVGSSLFTVFGNSERFVAVGGAASGIIVENDGSGWVDATPDPLPEGLTGVSLESPNGGFAVGLYGTIYERRESGWERVDHDLGLLENLHAVWVDPEGGVWAAGGNTFAPPLRAGLLIHRGGSR